MKKRSLFLSDRVYQIDLDSHRESMGLSFGIAGASFGALVALGCLSELSGYLLLSLYCFCVSLPLSLGHAVISLFVLRGGWSTRGSRILSVAIGQLSHLAVFAGIALMLFHISDIAASIFLIASGPLAIFVVLYARIYGNTCARLDARNYPEAPKIQPPLGKDEK